MEATRTVYVSALEGPAESAVTDVRTRPASVSAAPRAKLPRRRGAAGPPAPSPEPSGTPPAILYDRDRPRGVRVREARFRRLLALADVFAAAVALVLCVNVLGTANSLRLGAFLALPIVVVIGKLQGLYDRDELVLNKTTLDELPKLFQLATLYTLVISLLQQQLVVGELGAEQILVLWMALFGCSAAGRHLARRIATWTTAQERCVFVGSDSSLERLRDKLGQRGKARIVARMWMDEAGGNAAAAGVRVTELRTLHALIDEMDIDRVIVEPSEASPQMTLDFVRAAKATGARVSVLPRILEVVGTSIVLDDIDGLTLLGVRPFGLSRSSKAIKRSFDIVGAAAITLVLSPLLLLLALVVKLDSRGPVLYRAARVGRDGQIFHMWKFRSMVSGADAMRAKLEARNQAAAGLFKMADDPRLTRVGRRIRRASLDELPQLINVLRGEMSLVGPRPLVADEDARITGLDRRRLYLTPGMTGYWQILGSSRVPLTEMVKLDYVYVAGWSLWNDVKILLRTVPYVLARRGL